jgi:copper chaperone CopZ
MIQKIKFQIEGMDCHSCAKLIEEKLKEREGVLEAKVNYDSKKAVVVFDEQKIKESEIQKAIEEAGHYKAKKISDNEENKGRIKNNSLKMNEKSPNKLSFWFGFLVAFSIFSSILNIILLKPFLNLNNLSKTQSTVVQTEKINSSPSPTLPSNPQPAIQTFEITKENHVRGNFDAPVT